MRISLKYFLGVFVFFSIIFWCLSQVGFNSGITWFVCAVSSVMSAVFIYQAGDIEKQKRAYVNPLVVGMILFFFMPMIIFSFALLIHCLLLLIASLVCAYLPPMKKKSLSAIAMVCMAIAFIAGTIPGMKEAHRLAKMREEFPIVSLEDRLLYEQRKSPPAELSKVNLSTDTSARLTAQEQLSQCGNYRVYQLKRLHDRHYETFVRSLGFGVSRMARPRVESIRRPQLQDIPFVLDNREEIEYQRRGWQGILEAPQSNDLKNLHEISYSDFLDPDGFGAVRRSKQEIIGFIEHGFHYSPTNAMKDRDAWTIERLELVSLLKFEEPRVYVLEHLPRMDKLSSEDVPTRALNDFETTALEKLQTEEDYIITNDERHYLMLGSLRAGKQCLDCHSVQRGELLGAFSYAILQADSNTGG